MLFRRLSGIAMTMLAVGGALTAADPAPAQPVKATFAVSGLHCGPCTKTVERSLTSAQGVKSVKVDWATKNAKIEFDEHAISAQQIANRIAATSHMMGSSLHYGGTLSLSVPDLAAGGNANKAQEALLAVSGVTAATPEPRQKIVSVAFAAQGSVTSAQLVEALHKSGIEASLMP